MRPIPDLPKVLSGRGQLFQDDRSPIDVRYQIVLAVVPAVPSAHAAPAPVPPAVAPAVPGAPVKTDHAIGHLVILNRADVWRVDSTAEYQLTLTNGRSCRVALHHDPPQPFTKYRILSPPHDLL
jgi:hypothetical protein